jgi:hypothetical protein
MVVNTCPDLLLSQSLRKGSPPEPLPVESTRRKTHRCRMLAPYHPPATLSPRFTVPWMDHEVHAEKYQL